MVLEMVCEKDGPGYLLLFVTYIGNFAKLFFLKAEADHNDQTVT